MSSFKENLDIYKSMLEKASSLEEELTLYQNKIESVKSLVDSSFTDQFFSMAKDIPAIIDLEAARYSLSYQDLSLVNLLREYLDNVHGYNTYFGVELYIQYVNDSVVVNFPISNLIIYKQKYNLKIANSKQALDKLKQKLDTEFELINKDI